MKKSLTLIAASTLALLFTACGSEEKKDFVGYWHEAESDIVFEVLKNENQYIIRNVNGDLTADPSAEADPSADGKICGRNSLNMAYCMSLKGDSAYYEFADIVTGYKRISKEQYDKIFATKSKATFKPIEADTTVQD